MGQSFLVLSIQALLIGTSLENTNNFCGHFPSGDFTRACNFLNRWDDATKHLPGQIYKCTPSQGNTIYDCMDLACLCRFLNGTFTSKCLLPNGEELKKAVRKEYRSLTDEERERYHKAVRTIKQNGEYDKLSMIHTRSTTSPAAHGGPGFLGWHREFIKSANCISEIGLQCVLASKFWVHHNGTRGKIPKSDEKPGVGKMGGGVSCNYEAHCTSTHTLQALIEANCQIVD
ncbi:hypothetical protein Y032_0002g928 [Ancylostoma ceylanicum]|uniref:Tyrosinase copper-binding domain-containing protein n=1 Tax=Ancylostoma ceylanicum TaxID=53326 RepID=A0A016W1F6_9BILA|nr:hypothetical protein Y032_0002g928 [Ancylostoma ceylanicum]